MRRIVLAICILCIAQSGPLAAQTKDTSSATDSNFSSQPLNYAINFCPGGIAFGIYAFNVEFLLKPHHGLVARFDYEGIPKAYTDAEIESSGMAFILNYRWHISGEMESVFLGAYTRYKTYQGDGTLESTSFDFDLDQMTLGLNAGNRWVWDSGFNLTFALGYGLSTEDREANPSTEPIEATLDLFEEEYDFLSPFLGELSIGFAF
jgi:hypothetical protein